MVHPRTHAASQSPQELTEVNSSDADKWAPAGMKTKSKQRLEPRKRAEIKSGYHFST